MDMVVKIEEILDAGLVLDEPIDLKLLDSALTAEGDTGFRALSASKLKATLRKVSGGVLLKGSFEVELLSPCKRCLTDVKQQLPIAFTLNLVPESLARGDDFEDDDEEGDEQPGSFDLTDSDSETFDGKKIELDPIVREQVLLALPMNVLCREDCKGLCSTCGEDLNLKNCGHEQKVMDPRLSALKDIKLN